MHELKRNRQNHAADDDGDKVDVNNKPKAKTTVTTPLTTMPDFIGYSLALSSEPCFSPFLSPMPRIQIGAWTVFASPPKWPSKPFFLTLQALRGQNSL